MNNERDDRRRRGAARYLTVRYAHGATGAWDVVGPVNLVQVGYVKVTRKNRSTVIRQVHSLGEPFQRNGADFIRGSLTPARQEVS